MRWIFLIFFLTVASVPAVARLEGTRLADSLLRELPKYKDDTSRVNILAMLSIAYSDTKGTDGIKYADDALELAKNLHWDQGICKADNSLGVNYCFKDSLTKALEYFNDELKTAQNGAGKKYELWALESMAHVFFSKKNFPAAQSYALRALNICDSDKTHFLAEKQEILRRLINILYFKDNYGVSLKYEFILLCLKTDNESSEANFYNGTLFGIFIFVLLYNLALFYSTKEKSTKYIIGSIVWFFVNYLLGIGNYYNYIEVFFYHIVFVLSMFIMARLFVKFIYYFLVENETPVIGLGQLSTNLKIINWVFVSITLEILFLLFTKDRLNFLSINIVLGDLLLLCQMTYTLVLFVKNKLHKHTGVRFIVLAQGLLLTGVFFSVIFNFVLNMDNKLPEMSFAAFIILLSVSVADKINNLKDQKEKATKNALTLLEEKVEERTKEVRIKTKEITDNIDYAQRIQSAMLPDMKQISSTLHQSFVLYLPKDVVSGDFYTFSASGGRALIIAGDCTGHGVSGAFMSMIGSTLLNQIINVRGNEQPALILNQLNTSVIDALKQDENESNDGMDISMCSFDMENMQLDYAGANRPLWLIRNNGIITYKPDKFPIGGLQAARDRTFTNHTIQLQKNDTVYIFTDGYADQFGGEKGKKLMTAKFKEILISIQHMDMHRQQEYLKEFFYNWKNINEQVDDVLVIGVRV